MQQLIPDVAGGGGAPDGPGDNVKDASADGGASGGIIGIIKGFKEKTIELVAGVFRRPALHNDSGDASDDSGAAAAFGTTLSHGVACPPDAAGRRCTPEHGRQLRFLLAPGSRERRALARAAASPAMRPALENGVCQSLGFNFSSNVDDDVCVASSLVEFYMTLFGKDALLLSLRRHLNRLLFQPRFHPDDRAVQHHRRRAEPPPSGRGFGAGRGHRDGREDRRGGVRKERHGGGQRQRSCGRGGRFVFEGRGERRRGTSSSRVSSGRRRHAQSQPGRESNSSDPCC